MRQQHLVLQKIVESVVPFLFVGQTSSVFFKQLRGSWEHRPAILAIHFALRI